MTEYNESLSKSLGLLYDNAQNFKVSVGLVQKLAQHLKLDTFIDTDVDSGTSPGTSQRLSIAGSLLLLDLDFADDDKLTKVSLSSGNHTGEAEGTKKLTDPSNDKGKCIISESESDKVKVVKIDFSKGSGNSFLNVKHDENTSVAEHILLSNLTSGSLSKFPENLRYLANLDSMSPQDGDLVVYMDNLAQYLRVIHASEIQANPSNWEVEEGWNSRVGNILLNDVDEGLLGVILLFWKEYRFLDHGVPVDSLGLVHKAVLSIKEATLPLVDYLKDSSSSSWQLMNSLGEFQNYQFLFDGDSHLHNGQSVTSITSRNWTLNLKLANAVHIPKIVLDYLGLNDYTTAKKSPLNEAFKQLSEVGFLHYVIGEEGTKVSFTTEEISEYVLIESISLASLPQLPKILSILRNHLVISALIRNVSQTPNAVLLDAKAESAEANKKLKSTLKLPNDVTDEELVGLSTMTDSVDYMGVPILDSTADLKSFFKEESQDTMMRDESAETEMPNEIPQDSINFVVGDTLYDSPNTDVFVSVSGQIKSAQIQAQLVIANGKISKQQDDIDMEVDDDLATKFCRALALSEDPLLASDAIH